MAYCKAKMKSSGNKGSPCFLDRSGQENYQAKNNVYLYGVIKHILISLNSYMGTPNSVRISYNTSLLTES
jgi:hypothetical protein